MRILFIHGIAQGGKDPARLKQTWIDTLNEGLADAGTSLADDVSFDFPFYGDELDRFKAQAALPTPDDVISKGPGQNRAYEAFVQSALDQIYQASPLTEAHVEAEVTGGDVTEKGPQNWSWVQAIARALDKRFVDVSEWTIEQFLRDVYLYVNSPGVTRKINQIVENLITDEPTVVVGHSLGSVVGYRVIQDNLNRLDARKYVTVGCPLGIRAISAHMGFPANSARGGWYNAYDKRDIVALNPLDDTYFPTDPAIVNNNEVRNRTNNRHGIVGYLNDSRVAQLIAEATRRT